MPRPSKTSKRQRINAGLEYRRGNRAEAYKMWEAAAKARKERQAAKVNKKAQAEAEKK